MYVHVFTKKKRLCWVLNLSLQTTGQMLFKVPRIRCTGAENTATILYSVLPLALYLFYIYTGAVPGWSESTLGYPQGSQCSFTKGIPQRDY